MRFSLQDGRDCHFFSPSNLFIYFAFPDPATMIIPCFISYLAADLSVVHQVKMP